MPRVIIALPVYNGAPLLAEALEDLARQTHQDMRVIIFDNASEDATPLLAQAIIERDSRFSVVRRAKTLPLFEHFLATLEECDCEFFGWRAYDDLSSPNYVATLARLLAENPQAWVAGSQVRTYAVNKNRWRNHPAPPAGDGGLGATLNLMMRSHASWMYGLFRHDRLRMFYARALSSLPSAWGVDHATLLPMILNRACVTTNDTVFIQRKGIDPTKKPSPEPMSGEMWAVFRAFLDYTTEIIDETPGWSASERAALKLAAIPYAQKRTYRFTRMARRMVMPTL